MKLYLKQKVFSWRDRFYVKDETGEDRYYIEGEIFTWGKKLHVYNNDAEEVAYIQQKVFSWLPRYYIEIDGNLVCTVVKKFTFLKPKYVLEGLDWQLDGDFWAHEYSLISASECIMRLSKKWFTWGASYELDITQEANELVCLCLAVVVESVVAEEAASSQAASSTV